MAHGKPPCANGLEEGSTPEEEHRTRRVFRCKKLCRYGQACWRPDCSFLHAEAKRRATYFADLWMALASESHNKDLEDQAETRHPFIQEDVASQYERTFIGLEKKDATLQKQLDELE